MNALSWKMTDTETLSIRSKSLDYNYLTISASAATFIKIVASKRVNATRDQFETFYAEHKGKPFFEGLVEFMTSGPIVVQVLEKENAIQAWRDLMGKTDPAEAAEGTIRKKYAESKGHNSVHGSDSPASAEREINLWFTPDELK